MKPTENGHPNGRDDPPADLPDPLAEAEALRNALAEAAHRAGRLVALNDELVGRRIARVRDVDLFRALDAPEGIGRPLRGGDDERDDGGDDTGDACDPGSSRQLVAAVRRAGHSNAWFHFDAC